MQEKINIKFLKSFYLNHPNYFSKERADDVYRTIKNLMIKDIINNLKDYEDFIKLEDMCNAYYDFFSSNRENKILNETYFENYSQSVKKPRLKQRLTNMTTSDATHNYAMFASEKNDTRHELERFMKNGRYFAKINKNMVELVKRNKSSYVPVASEVELLSECLYMKYLRNFDKPTMCLNCLRNFDEKELIPYTSFYEGNAKEILPVNAEGICSSCLKAKLEKELKIDDR